MKLTRTEIKRGLLHKLAELGVGDQEFEYRLQRVNEAESILKLADVLKKMGSNWDFPAALLESGTALALAGGIGAGTGALLSDRHLTDQDVRLVAKQKEIERMKILAQQLERDYGIENQKVI